MINLISQVTFISLTQIYYNMNFIKLSSNFIARFPWYFKISLHWLLLEDNFLAHKKNAYFWICLQNIRNFVKMQGNLWKISCSLPTLLKILVFHNFFPKFSGNCILRTSIFQQKPKSVYYVDFYEFRTTRWLPNIWQAIPHFPKK